jgi:predicted transposase YbfD/YdcC
MLPTQSSVPAVATRLLDHLAQIPDPRVDRTKRHLLGDILAIAILATLCGADSFTEIEQFGRARERWLRGFLTLPGGIPSHDTFTRVFARLDRQAFAAALGEWAKHTATLALHPSTRGEVVAIDGKSVRRSYDLRAGQAALHSVSAWATERQMVLGQVETKDHSNEITAIPELLDLLELKGTTVTIDAIGCQKKITTAIRAKKAHYVLALKSNQPWLHQRVHAFHQAVTAQPKRYWRDIPHLSLITLEKEHGRLEKRCYTVMPAEAVLRNRSGWEDLKSVGWVETERTLLSGRHKGKTTREVRYFISSLPPEVEPFAHAVRSHWAIENRCHWVLDVVFQEDQSRVRKDHGPANLVTLRRWALNLLRQDTTHKLGLKARRLHAAWDPDYLLTLLRRVTPQPVED